MVLTSFCGPRASVSLRAKVAGCAANMKRALSPFSCELQASAPEGLALQLVVDKVRATAAIDGDEVGAESAYSVEAFMAGLREEAKISSKFFGDDGVSGDGGADIASRAPADVVNDLHKGGMNWALFSVRE